MRKKKLAIFVASNDGFDVVLSFMNHIKKQNVNLHLYTYTPNRLPKFFLAEFSEVNQIPQAFYSRVYSKPLQKLTDRCAFLKLFIKSILSKSKTKAYDEMHILAYQNNPSFLMYEIMLGHKDCLVFHYKVPNHDFYTTNKLRRDWKLWVLERIFSKNFVYYEYPPNKTNIGISESHLKIFKASSWQELSKSLDISPEMLNVNIAEKNKVLVLGTQFGGLLGKVKLDTTAQKIIMALIKKFPHQPIYYKAHYRSDFDLYIPNMKVLDPNIPAEFIVPFFDVVCGFDSTTFRSCVPGTRMISFLKLMDYCQGDFNNDLDILKNVTGSKKFSKIEFFR